MSRSKGRRYNKKAKLNKKKVAAVIIAILVIIMFVIGLGKILKDKPETNEKSFVLAYYTIYENGKWGVMDTKENIIIEPSYTDMIVVPNNTKPVFICMENVNYENGTYDSKAVNEKNEKLYENYDKVETITNHDNNNNLWYEANVLKVQKDGKYGLINLEGKELVKCEYDNITVIEGTTNAFVTVKDNKQGLVDGIGNLIIENNYSEITALTSQYENGFIVKADNNKYGVIRYDKTIALDTKYDEIKNVYGNNMYVVKENGNWKIVNNEQETFLEGGFEEVKTIQTENVIVKKNGKYGVVTIHGETKIEAIYDDLTYAFLNYYIAKKDNQYGIVTAENETKVNFDYTYIKYVQVADFIEAQKENGQSDLLDRNFNIKVTGMVNEINEDKNYIRVRVGEEYKYYNFKLEEKTNQEILSTNTIFLSKKNGKYGYVNSKGIVVVDYIYDDATEQNKYGYVAVKKDGKWGSLNQKGEVVAETMYPLTNYVVVNFIGKWHLAQDINANYYTIEP